MQSQYAKIAGATALLLALTASVAVAGAVESPVGMASMTVSGNTASRGDRSDRLRVVVWFPAAAGTPMTAMQVGPPQTPYFSEGEAAGDVPIAAAPARLPLVVVSHGTGGTSMDLSWLCGSLAAHGYLVASVDDPGDNALQPATVSGLTLWWLRADDLTHVIDGILASQRFGPRVDSSRIGAAGFSLGGYTVLVLGGVRGDSARLAPYCVSHPTTPLCTGEATPAIPNFNARAADLATHDPVYSAAAAANAASHRDPRVRAILSIAPALGPAIIPESLASIEVPVALIAGFGDPILPVGDNVIPDAQAIANAELTIFPKPAGHYTFLTNCAPAGAVQLASICGDSGPARIAIHEQTERIARAFFDRSLHL